MSRGRKRVSKGMAENRGVTGKKISERVSEGRLGMNGRWNVIPS